MVEELRDSNSGCCCRLTKKELLGGTNIMARDWRFINPELWDDDVNAPDNNIDETVATTYMARAIADYTERPTTDDELFGEFCQDFEGWTEVMFGRAHPTYRKELKRILRFKGVYTGRVKIPPSKAMFELLNSEDCPSWPNDQFERTAFDKRSAAYMLQQRLAQERRPAELIANTVEHIPQFDQQLQQGQQSPSTCNEFDEFRDYTPAYSQCSKEPSVPLTELSGDMDPYKAIPPMEFSNERLNPAAINAFIDVWERDKKYTGKLYDLLDDKLKIFYSICYHANIRPGQFHAVFPRILDGRAEQYYLHFVDQRADTFLTAYTKLKNYFDAGINHGHYYAEWTTISFPKIQRENPDMSLHEVLDVVLDRLQTCQRALAPQCMGETILRSNVVRACRGVRELEMALYRPPVNCEVLFTDLRLSIEQSLEMAVFNNPTGPNLDDEYHLGRRYKSHNGRSGFTRGRGGI